MNLRLAIKNQGANVFCKAGGLKLLYRGIAKTKAFVLMYHRILDSPESEAVPVQPGMYVKPSTFRQHLAFLKSRFHVLHLSEVAARIRAGKSVGGCCAITFDDGWQDNYTLAYPLLKEFNLPATIFLATGFIGTERCFWPEEAGFYLQQPRVVKAGRDCSILRPFLDNLPVDTMGAQRLEHAIAALKAMSTEEREVIIARMHDLSGKNPPVGLLMGWDAVKRMQEESLVVFGAHSHNHVILDQVPLVQAEQEILKSREILTNKLGAPPDLFAYPNGNYSKELQHKVKKHGFNVAVTTRKDWFNNSVSLLEIPRIGVHEDVSRTMPLFISRLFLKRF